MRLKCPKCGGYKMQSGYGFRAGPLVGGYVFCGMRKCGALVEIHADVEGLEPEQEREALAAEDRVRAENGLPPRE